MRKTYLGGSDLGAVICVNKYKTALDVYLEKTSEHSPERLCFFTPYEYTN